jgi:hypothetical protein
MNTSSYLPPTDKHNNHPPRRLHYYHPRYIQEREERPAPEYQTHNPDWDACDSVAVFVFIFALIMFIIGVTVTPNNGSHGYRGGWN